MELFQFRFFMRVKIHSRVFHLEKLGCERKACSKSWFEIPAHFKNHVWILRYTVLTFVETTFCQFMGFPPLLASRQVVLVLGKKSGRRSLLFCIWKICYLSSEIHPETVWFLVWSESLLCFHYFSFLLDCALKEI